MPAPRDHVTIRPPRRRPFTPAGRIMIALIFTSPVLALAAIVIALARTP